MKKRDRVIVAVILAAALIVGLTLVRRALDLSAQAQADLLASAQFNGVGAASAEEAADQFGGENSDAGEDQTAQPGGDAAGDGGQSEDEAEDGAGAAEGTDASAGSAQPGQAAAAAVRVSRGAHNIKITNRFFTVVAPFKKTNWLVCFILQQTD